MKIVCPKCQAAYEIDIPESPQKDISAKCAVCNTKFPVRERAPQTTSKSHLSMSGPPLAQIESNLDADPEDDLLFGLKEEVEDLQGQNEEKPLEDENNLDDYLDRFLDDESGNGENPSFEPPVEQPPEEPSTIEDSSAFEMPSEEELDDLFQSIITEEINSENPEDEATTPTSSLEKDLEEDELDAFFDEVISDIDGNPPENVNKGVGGFEVVMDTPDFPAEEDDKLDQELSDLLQGAGSPAVDTDDLDMANDSMQEILEEVQFDQVGFDKQNMEPGEQTDDITLPSYDDPDLPETMTDSTQMEGFMDQEVLPETPEQELQLTIDDSEFTANHDASHRDAETEQSDDDLATEILAGQKSFNDAPEQEVQLTIDDSQLTGKNDLSTPEPHDEKSYPDPVAETQVEQEAFKETPQEEAPPNVEEPPEVETTPDVEDPPPAAEKEVPAPEAEGEKSDDDLWAEAFADQEALKETPEEETKPAAQETPPAAEKETPAPAAEEEKSDDDLWAEAFADQEALKETPEEETKPAAQETPPAAEKETPAPAAEEEKSDDDLWAEAFADQEALKETPEEETKPAAQETPPAAEKETPAPAAEEEKSDDDLWAEAFADQEALKETPEEETKPAAQETPPAAEKDEPIPEPGDENKEEEPPIEALADPGDISEDKSPVKTLVDPDEESEDANPLFESDEEDWENEVAEIEDQYDNYEDDDEEYSPPQKKKSGIFSMPSTLTGKLILGGSVLAILLTGGGAYFALQTLAPPELTQMGKNESQVPDGLKPNPVGDPPAPSSTASESTSTAATNPPESAQGSAPAPVPGANPAQINDKELKEAIDPLGAALKPDVSEGLLASLAPSNHAVQLTTIMPVAYNVNDIRVLSLSLEAEMSDEESAKVVQEALPVFEKITTSTIEKLMDKKFFNDILYVQEKLKKNLQTNFNKALEGGGRVKKINFTEFTIQ